MGALLRRTLAEVDDLDVDEFLWWVEFIRTRKAEAVEEKTAELEFHAKCAGAKLR